MSELYDVELQVVEVKQQTNEERLKELLDQMNMVLERLRERKKKASNG